MTSTSRNTRAKWTLAAVALLSSVGVVASLVLYAVDWRPAATKNYGELVQPARPLNEVVLHTPAGQPVRVSALRGRWTLVYFGPAECDKHCTDALYKMRQLVLARGRDAHRLRRVFVATDARALDALRETVADYPGTEVWTGAAGAVRAFAAQFALPGGGRASHRLYVVDPIGNYMMSYPADADLRRMNKDIGLLLRTSQVG
jgi:cytochrome oxidase Cu insertion factor (SCO1/SenC/PrrC family)